MSSTSVLQVIVQLVRVVRTAIPVLTDHASDHLNLHATNFPILIAGQRRFVGFQDKSKYGDHSVLIYKIPGSKTATPSLFIR